MRLTKSACVQRESSASIKAAPTAYEQAEPAKAQKVVEFDCRGLEFTEFKPEVRWRSFASRFLTIADVALHGQGEWLAEGAETGSKFTAIELTEGEWFDYDEKNSEEVSIKDLSWEIRRA